MFNQDSISAINYTRGKLKYQSQQRAKKGKKRSAPQSTMVTPPIHSKFLHSPLSSFIVCFSSLSTSFPLLFFSVDDFFSSSFFFFRRLLLFFFFFFQSTAFLFFFLFLQSTAFFFWVKCNFTHIRFTHL